MPLEQLAIFSAAGLWLNLAPGPDVVFIAAAALGIGALLAASSTAFGFLKWVGLKMLFTRSTSARSLTGADRPDTGRARGLKSIFMMGFWTHVLNPKVALFFLAFVLLGLRFNVNAMWVISAWALLAAGLAQRVDGVRRAGFMREKIAGLMFLGFGTQLALSDAPTQPVAS